jgi:hypothetical protein
MNVDFDRYVVAGIFSQDALDMKDGTVTPPHIQFFVTDV